MTRLLRAEALRLATSRAYWLLVIGATILIAGGVAATAAATSFTPGASPARSVLAIAGLAQTVALLAGVLSVTGEFRHKTITPAALITPRRTPLLGAKLIILAAAGLVFGLAATAIATAITLPLLVARHIPAGTTGSGVASAWARSSAIRQVRSSPSSPCCMSPNRCWGSSPTSAPPSSNTASAAWPPPPPTPSASRPALTC